MPAKSSYLSYLPTVLWEREPPLPDFSLGAMLRIFEKILTGFADAEVIRHGDHEHDSIEEVIDRLHRLFDPWTTPPDFLDWLASWVALRFPDIWDDYQRRKVTSEAAQIYQRRGLKEGLDQYLDLYTVAEKRPRIVIDDCSKVLFTRPEPGRFARVHTLVSQQPLVAPLCIAVGPDGTLLVGDIGKHAVGPKAVWRISPTGQYTFAGMPPTAQPIGPAGWNLEQPAALAVDPASPWSVYVLDRVLSARSLPALYKLSSPDFATYTVIATKTTLKTVWPVAMALDTVPGHLLILDRGAIPGAALPAPFIIDVALSPFSATTHPLVQVIEPLSLLVRPNGDVVVGDARHQSTPVPADLMKVDRTTWQEAPLLSAVPAGRNPLTAPMAVVHEDAGHVLVLDLGLKPLQSPASPYLREIAEPAAIYRVDLGVAPPVVSRISETRQLVSPTGMALHKGTLYVSDRGEYSNPMLAGPLFRDWRSAAHEFGVVIHFSRQRLTTSSERKRIVQDVREIVDAESPAHTSWTMVFGV